MLKLELLETSFKVGICISSCGYSKIGFSISLSAMTPYLSNVKVYPELPNQSYTVRVAEGSSISNNRHLLVQDVLKDEFTHVCFIDDDISFPRYSIHKLASWRKPVVGVNYHKRSKDGGFVASKPSNETENGFKQVITTENSHFIEEVSGLGFGLCLIETEVFKKLPQPWFEFRWEPEVNMYMGEDISFCRLCNSHKIPLYIDHDLSREIVHTGNYPFRWDDRFQIEEPKKS